jgi:hypothetical protein
MMGLDVRNALSFVAGERGGKAAQAIVIFATMLVLDVRGPHVSYFVCGSTRRHARPIQSALLQHANGPGKSPRSLPAQN